MKSIPEVPPTRPIDDSYVVPGTRLIAGEYPGCAPDVPADEAEAKLRAFLRAGIDVFVDLTDPADRLEPYHASICALAGDRPLPVHLSLPIRDMDVCDVSTMTRILDVIDSHLDAGRTVYVHCWGGVGRTGTVVGCWLARHGGSGEAALEMVAALFSQMSPKKLAAHAGWGSPQTEAQRAMVRRWVAGPAG